MEEKKTFGERCKEGWHRHKKKVIVVGGVVVFVAGCYLVSKNWDDILKAIERFAKNKELPQLAEECAEVAAVVADEPQSDVVVVTKEVMVSLHKMNLPQNKNPSAAALARAHEAGIVLEPHQTVRGPFPRNIAA